MAGGNSGDILNELMAKHGVIIGTVKVDEYLTRDVGGVKLQERNPNPQYRVIFADGTHATLRATASQPDPNDPDRNVPTAWEVTDPGTALNTKAPKDNTPSPTSQWSIQTKADGSKVRVNELTGEVLPLEGFDAKAAKNTGMYIERPREEYNLENPGAGAVRWTDRTPVVDTITRGNQLWGLPEGGSKYQLMQEFPSTSSGGSGDSTAWARLAWDKERADQQTAFDTKKWAEQTAFDTKKWAEQLAWWREEQDRKEAEERQKLRGTLANWMTSARIQAAPYAMLPGQQYFLGAEPGGAYSNIARMSGRTFDPNTMRPQPVNVDPLESWRVAQGMVGGK